MSLTSSGFAYRDRTTEESGRRDRCPECEGEAIRIDDVRGELVCRDCGCVLGDRLVDAGAEWTAFDHDEERTKSRVGPPLTSLLHDRGLTTKIHWKDTDAKGRPLSARKQRTMKRLRTWQRRLRVGKSSESNLQFALSELHRMASALDLPDQASRRASRLYRRALEEGLVQGRSIEAMTASCLYVACRKEGIPRSLDELETVSRIERTEIARAYRQVAAELGLTMEPVEPKLFVPRFCSDLAASPAIQRRTLELLAEAEGSGLHSGKSPTGQAGAAIYLASLFCGEALTQTEVAEVARVSEVTIRNGYRELLDAVDEEL
jgi:transcription initiation factor TFIIB